MEENLKRLLLKDLCARLPYHPKGHVVNACNGAECDEWLTCATFPMFTSATNNCRLYLRPMSSMTKEELYEVQEILGKGVEIHDVFISIVDSSINTFSYLELQAVFEWFNANHFDHGRLIEKGLAIEVTENNNPYKE